ncbi:MAG: TonB-dependent receptor [Bacteroidales bacterium]|nr:TonB-dependent receptor [Bacteroidales bacterium]MCF8391448.1 TonB-dependent receptor [Bacteroidales bacterium]
MIRIKAEIKKAIAFSLIVFSFFPAFGQETVNLTQTLRGTVSDKVTGSAVIGANVIIVDTNPIRGTVTDIFGNFRFEKVPVGRQSIEISYIGYNKIIIPNLLLTSGKEMVVNVKLEEKAYLVDEITIRPDRKKEKTLNEMVTVSGRMFSVEETERFAGSLGDPALMVANYAGVMTQNDTRNDIIIRGNSPSGVLWKLEGIEIGNPNHFGSLGTTGGPVSMINNNLLTDSDFLTGAFPAEIGNATAGVFDLNLRSGNNQKMEFTGQVGINGFEIGTEGPFKIRETGPNPSYLINYRYSTLNVMHKLGISTGTGTAIPEYNDLTFIVDVPGTKAGRFKLFGLRGISTIELGYDIQDTTENSFGIRGTSTDFASELDVIGLSHNYYFNESSSLKSTLSYQFTEVAIYIDSLRENSDKLPYYRSLQAEEKLSLSSVLKKKINARDNFQIGYVADFFRVNFSDSIHVRNTDYFRILANSGGNMALIRSFGQFQHKFKNNIKLRAGLHFQYAEMNNELAAEPRLGLSLPAGKGSINFGFGLHSQLQPKASYFLEYYDSTENSYTKTNQDIGFSRSIHFVAGYDFLSNKNIRIKLETYYQHLYKIPIKESFPEFSMINSGDFFALPRENFLINEGLGKNYGIELTLEKFLSDGYYFLFTSSLFNSKYAGYDQIWRNTAFNGNYVFNFLGGYEFKLGRRGMITLDSKTVLAGGKRYLPIDIEASILEDKDVRDWEHAFEEKYEPYFRTDFRIGLKMNGKKFSQEWGIDIQNLTNYQSLFTENYDANKQEVYKTYQRGFLPLFLYRIQF